MNRNMEKYNDINIDLFPEGKRFRFVYDSTVDNIKVICKYYDDFESLVKTYSDVNPTAFFSKQYGYNVEEKISVINKFGYFAPGLLFDILKYIKNIYGSMDVVAMSKKFIQYIDDNLLPLKPMINESDDNILNISDDRKINESRIKNGKEPFEFRDYQRNSIYSLIYSGLGRGLIEIPTAGGKSLILANFIWNIKNKFNNKWKTLLLVPNKQLVAQMYGDFLEYGYTKDEVTMFTAGSKYDLNKSIIIANRQYIFKNSSKLPDIDILICDEAHQCTSEATAAFINDMNCKIKIGCSGTLPRGNLQKWNLTGMFSKTVYAEEITTLQDKGFISKLKISILKIHDRQIHNDTNCLFSLNTTRKYRPDDPTCDLKFDDSYNAELEYFTKWYKDLYTPVLNYLNGLDENILVLFDRLEIGKNIFDLAKTITTDRNIWYIDGSTNVNDREDIRSTLEKSGNNILFAQSSIMSTGVNIKRLNHIVFMFNTKSFSRVLQSIGRTLRLHYSKKEAHLIDVCFDFKYSEKHLNERLKIYRQSYHKKPDEIIKFEI